MNGQNIINIFAAASLSVLAACGNHRIGPAEIIGNIDFKSAAQFNHNLNIQEQRAGKDARIVIPIHSGGGLVNAANNMQRNINETKADITLKCNSRAGSMAGILLVTSFRAARDASSDCEILIHSVRIDLNNDARLSSNTPESFVTQTELKAAYEAIKNDPDLESVDVSALPDYNGEARVFRLNRDYIEKRYRYLIGEDTKLIRKLDQFTDLNQQDLAYFYGSGDVRFDVYEAGFIDMIDTIEGEPVTTEQEQRGKQSLCARYPSLSVC